MNTKAFFGEGENLFGGQFVPEHVILALKELEQAYEKYVPTEEFQNEYQDLLKNYLGRETPVTFAKNLSEYYGHNIYLKREDLNHTGSHKMNNALGQALLAKRMGKKKVIAETGAGQHGVATATAAALMGLECDIYMGAEDMRRQRLNVFRMQLLGAKVFEVNAGLKTLSDAVDAAIDVWAKNADELFYLLGSAVGPHPYPKIVRDFQSVIGKETKAQLQEIGVTPNHVIACIGGGSNAIGIFSAFIDDPQVKLYAAEAGGLGLETGKHSAAISKGKHGTIHGMKTYVMQDDDGNILPAYSISAGLDYPGVGPEHAYLHESKRVLYETITDDEAMTALQLLTRKEGIIPALESSHAVAYLEKLCPRLDKTKKENIVINISGRGDKDMESVFAYLEAHK